MKPAKRATPMTSRVTAARTRASLTRLAGRLADGNLIICLGVRQRESDEPGAL
jgi:hypothetical protein